MVWNVLIYSEYVFDIASNNRIFFGKDVREADIVVFLSLQEIEIDMPYIVVSSKELNNLDELVDTVMRRRNLMLFVPWADQGLGIQCREYCRLLSDHYNIFILSSLPYQCKGRDIRLQHHPSEWEKYYKGIYYSLNTREEVTPSEFRRFVKHYDIGKCIIPEPCYPYIFQRCRVLKDMDVQLYAIPNIELVRREDIPSFDIFDAILCNTHVCQELLPPHLEKRYIGHFVKEYGDIDNKPSSQDIKLVSIGGYNCMERKNFREIMRAFNEVCEARKDLFLSLSLYVGRSQKK